MPPLGQHPGLKPRKYQPAPPTIGAPFTGGGQPPVQPPGVKNQSVGANVEPKKVKPVAPPGGKKNPCIQLIPGDLFHRILEIEISIIVESQGFKQARESLITVDPGPERYVTTTVGTPILHEANLPVVTMLLTEIFCPIECVIKENKRTKAKSKFLNILIFLFSCR